MPRRFLGGVARAQVARDDRRVDLDAGVLERHEVPLVALLGGVDRGEVTEEGDTPVTAGDQVRDRQ